MPHTVSSLMFMYADDAKVARVVSTISDCDRQTWIASGLLSRDHGLETRVHSSSFCQDLGLGLGFET